MFKKGQKVLIKGANTGNSRGHETDWVNTTGTIAADSEGPWHEVKHPDGPIAIWHVNRLTAI